jgi:hypothetical protein
MSALRRSSKEGVSGTKMQRHIDVIPSFLNGRSTLMPTERQLLASSPLRLPANLQLTPISLRLDVRVVVAISPRKVQGVGFDQEALPLVALAGSAEPNDDSKSGTLFLDTAGQRRIARRQKLEIT